VTTNGTSVLLRGRDQESEYGAGPPSCTAIASQTLPNVMPEPVVPFGSVQAVNWAQSAASV
jgi:hypothetical protein